MSLADGMYPDGEPIYDDSLAGSGEVIDVTRTPDPEDFDFDAFVEGARPGRRGVFITQRPDLMVELDEMVAEAAKLSPGDKAAEVEFEERFNDLKSRIERSQRMFVVEARSQARGRQIKKLLEKQGVVQPGKKATDDERAAYNETLSYHRLADAIITPSGVTAESLRAFSQVAESEVNKLFGAFNTVCTDPVDGLRVDPNFLLRR